MTGDDRDVALLRRAVELALGNATSGQLPFGAVVARGDDVLATGVNTALRDHDPAAHAEVHAVRAACRTLGTLSLAGSTLYSSCEPVRDLPHRRNRRRGRTNRVRGP